LILTVPALIVLAVWGYTVFNGIASGETTSGWGPFWLRGDPKKRPHWCNDRKAWTRWDEKLHYYVPYSPTHGERAWNGESWVKFDSRSNHFVEEYLFSAAQPRREAQPADRQEPSLGTFLRRSGGTWERWDEQKEVFRAFKPSHGQVIWDGARWVRYDIRVRRFVAEEDFAP
jgi:hypothetical protein